MNYFITFADNRISFLKKLIIMIDSEDSLVDVEKYEQKKRKIQFFLKDYDEEKD